MRIIVEWIDDAPDASSQETATLCELRIMAGDVNACRHQSPAGGAQWDSVIIPAVYLAEGIATDWEDIFEPGGPRRSIQHYRTGYVLPPVEFSCNATEFHIFISPMKRCNPSVEFQHSAQETVPIHEAEQELAGFVAAVVGRLHAAGLSDTETQLQWELLQEAWLDDDSGTPEIDRGAETAPDATD